MVLARETASCRSDPYAGLRVIMDNVLTTPTLEAFVKIERRRGFLPRVVQETLALSNAQLDGRIRAEFRRDVQGS